MTLSRVKEQATQKVFEIKTCSKSIIRISKQCGGGVSVSKPLHLVKPVCDATNVIYGMYIEHL